SSASSRHLREKSAGFFLPLSLFFQSFANPKHVTIRVPQMHFAHAPRHVGRREGNVEPCRHAVLVNRVHVLHPHGHPRAFVCALVSVRAEGGDVRASSAASLASLAQKNLAASGAHCPERRFTLSVAGGRRPVPALPPAPLLEPRKARGNVWNIQDRRNAFRIHGAEAYHLSGFSKAGSRPFGGAQGKQLKPAADSLSRPVGEAGRISPSSDRCFSWAGVPGGKAGQACRIPAGFKLRGLVLAESHARRLLPACFRCR